MLTRLLIVLLAILNVGVALWWMTPRAEPVAAKPRAEPGVASLEVLPSPAPSSASPAAPAAAEAAVRAQIAITTIATIATITVRQAAIATAIPVATAVRADVFHGRPPGVIATRRAACGIVIGGAAAKHGGREQCAEKAKFHDPYP